jgi:hypothetical protein
MTVDAASNIFMLTQTQSAPTREVHGDQKRMKITFQRNQVPTSSIPGPMPPRFF